MPQSENSGLRTTLLKWRIVRISKLSEINPYPANMENMVSS